MSKVYALNRSHLATFRKALTEASQRLGGTDYEVFYELATLETSFAQIATNSNFMVATATLANRWPDREPTVANLTRCARHEAIHLFLAPIEDAARRRYITPYELEQLSETFVHRLEHVLGWNQP